MTKSHSFALPRLKAGAATLVAALFGAAPAFAQSTTAQSDTDLSKDAENPVTRHITLPLRYEADFLDGAGKAVKDTVELDQAVLPFRLNDDWSLITRTKFQVIDQPPKKAGDKSATGVSNGYTTFFLSPDRGEGFYWGAGPILYYPSGGNPAIGVPRWGSGPSVAALRRDASPVVLGVVVNNIWSLGGPPGTNQLLVNPIASYHFGDGWSVGTSPNITANWLASGGKWTLPLGGGLDKLVRLGAQPVKLSLDAYYNAVRPKAGNDTWLLQATMTFLLPD